jgi:hypothetical protein
MQSTGISSSDIEEAFYYYALLVQDQDKPKNCTRLTGNPETDYPDTNIKVVRFLDNIEEDSEKVPGLKYHDRTLFRVLFYQEIKYDFTKIANKYLRSVYTSDIFPITRFNIHAPTMIGDFPIDRFVQGRREDNSIYLNPK